jgi:DNA-binding MarR family transcriptional regulator
MQKELAEKRNVEPSTVTRSLQSANFNLYVVLKDATEDAIINIWEKMNGQ